MITIKLDIAIKPVQEILKAHGLDAGGAVQKKLTLSVLHRMTRYMPYRSGALIHTTEIGTVPKAGLIFVPGPAARMLYYGKVMVDPVRHTAGFFIPGLGWRSRKDVNKVVSERNLNYTKTPNQKAGPFWDKAMMVAEGDQLIAEMQEYIDRGNFK